MRFFWGVLLAGSAAGFTGLLIAYNAAGGPTYTPQLAGQALPMTPRLTTLGVFCSGIALGLIFCTGMWLLAGSIKHRRHRASAQQAAPRGAAPVGSYLGRLQLPAPPPPAPRRGDEQVLRAAGGQPPELGARVRRLAR